MNLSFITSLKLVIIIKANNRSGSEMKPDKYMWFSVITAAIIFVVDLAVPPGVVFGVPYILVILITFQSSLRHAVIITAVLTTLLVILELVLSPENTEVWEDYFNRTIVVFIIWIIALIGLFKKQKEDSLKESEIRFRTVFELTNDVIWEWDIINGTLTWYGDIDTQLGYEKNEFPRTIDAWNTILHSDDRDRVLEHLTEHLEKHVPWQEEYRVVRKDGKVRYWHDRGQAGWDKEGAAFLMTGSILDITESKQKENKLNHMASHDPLTGLYNRNMLEQRLADEIERALRYKHFLSVFMLDIDHFKPINDTYGHLVGDSILNNFANILESSIRHTDYTARYGGDEFVVILPETSLTKAEELAERLRKQITEYSFPIEHNKEIKITASIGIASFPEHAKTEQELLNAADSAMYHAKQAGRNQVNVFNCSMAPPFND